jgi:hypothetical protein
MNISELLEAKFAKEKTLYYHGTGAKYLKSILKQGLIPNKMEGGFGSEEKDISFDYELTPLDGVYITSHIGRATIAAKDASQSTESDPIIFVISGQSRENLIDEDQIFFELNKIIAKLVSDFNYEHSYEPGDEDVEDFASSTIEVAMKHLKDKAQKNSSTIHVDSVLNHVKPEIESYVNELISSSLEGNSPDIKHLQSVLTKKLRTLFIKSGAANSFRLEKTIGFSGATKIVGIVNLGTGLGWGETGTLRVKHHVPQPMHIIQS